YDAMRVRVYVGLHLSGHALFRTIQERIAGCWITAHEAEIAGRVAVGSGDGSARTEKPRKSMAADAIADSIDQIGTERHQSARPVLEVQLVERDRRARDTLLNIGWRDVVIRMPLVGPTEIAATNSAAAEVTVHRF